MVSIAGVLTVIRLTVWNLRSRLVLAVAHNRSPSKCGNMQAFQNVRLTRIWTPRPNRTRRQFDPGCRARSMHKD